MQTLKKVTQTEMGKELTLNLCARGRDTVQKWKKETHTQSEMEEEIGLSTASKNHGKNDSNPNRGLNQQQARIVDENHGYFTCTAEIVPLRLLFQLIASTKQ